MDTSPENGKKQSYENYHHLHPHSHHHHGTLSAHHIIVIVVSIISLVALFAICMIIIMLRRIKSASTCEEKCSSINNKGSSGKFVAHTTINNFTSSPDVKGGCLHRAHSQSNSTRATRKSRGVQVFTYRELEVATNGFGEANVIGIGGFGVVYRGTLIDGTAAAIKRLHCDGKQGERAFRLEVDLLSRLNSPYLVELLGYCADQSHRLLIFEFMPNGTLTQHLHRHASRCPPLDWGARLRIALDCARALEFLHEHSLPPIIHRDFKCSNVLLDNNLRAKVSDFGLAKLGSDKINGLTSSRVLGTTGYLAPEYASTGKLTTKSDVYSYGVVLLELLTGRTPVDPNRPAGEHVLVSWALPRLTNREKVEHMVDPAIKGQYSKKDLIQVAAIAAMCVQSEPDYRPLMTDVVQSLIPLVKSFNISFGSNNSSRFNHQPVDLSLLQST